jgi:hypothetical protein
MSQPESLKAAERPSRLPLWLHLLTLMLVALSSCSGAVLLYYELTTEDGLTKPDWLHGFRVFHGCLYPFQSALFGYLLCQHIRYGWQLKANRISGFLMEACFAGLIFTGIGLYYLDALREVCQQVHSVFGVLLPISLGAHWFAARRWVRALPLLTSGAA